MIIEVSFECGNKVGGIWTVITTKSRLMRKIFGDNYLCIGFYNPHSNEIIEKDPPEWLEECLKKLEKEGIEWAYGEWVFANFSNIILLNTKKFEYKNVNWIKGKFWEVYRIDSLFSGPDYNEPLAWSYAAGMLVEEIAKRKNVVVHCHEWLAGGTILYLKWKKVNVPTVFTTHATVLGRAIGDINRILRREIDPDKECYKYGIQAKHLTEKATAKVCDVFTAVSEIVAKECEIVLGRKPDIITKNCLDRRWIGDIDELIPRKFEARRKIDDFIRFYFIPYYHVDPTESPIIFTSGRYEFWNKGLDIFIDALGELNKRFYGTDKQIFVFILVPTGIIGVKDFVLENFIMLRRLKENLRERFEKIYYKGIKEEEIKEMMLEFKRVFRKRIGNPPLTPMRLSYREEDDLIIKRLLENGLDNRKENPVKVIYYPVYLNMRDPLLDLDYKEFVLGASVGVFPSRYEPWGYTPMEAAALLSISVTTDLTGFGIEVKKIGEPRETGIFVVEMRGKNRDYVVRQIADILETICKMERDKRLELELKAHKTIVNNFLWENGISNYLRAYDLARERAFSSRSDKTFM